MKTTRPTYLFVLIWLIASILLSAASPMLQRPIAGVNAREELVRFIVSNRTGKPLTVKLEGPRAYVLFVPGFAVAVSQKTTFTVERGDYRYTVFACSTEVKGKLNLNGQKTLIVPVCKNYPRTPQGVNKVDFPSPPKQVQIVLINKSLTHITITLSGPADYIFFVGKGETREPIILKGRYDFKYTACEDSDYFKFDAIQGTVVKMYCP